MGFLTNLKRAEAYARVADKLGEVVITVRQDNNGTWSIRLGSKMIIVDGIPEEDCATITARNIGNAIHSETKTYSEKYLSIAKGY